MNLSTRTEDCPVRDDERVIRVEDQMTRSFLVRYCPRKPPIPNCKTDTREIL